MPNNKLRRVGLLDEIRGLCIAGVVIFHAMYNLINVFGLNISSPGILLLATIVQPLGAGAFTFISGIVSRYSRNNIKRGLIAVAFGFGVSIVTRMVSPDLAVNFGVLSMLGSCMLIYGIAEMLSPYVRNLTSKGSSAVVGCVIFAVLFIITFGVPHGYIGLLSKELFTIPARFYQSDYLYFLGFPNESFYSTDYFPLIPWLFLYLSGTFLGVLFKEDKMPEFFYKSYCPFFKWLGKHSMIIYIVHQPILFGIMTLIFKLTN